MGIRNFLLKTGLLLGIVFLIILIGVLLPTTPKASKTMFFAKKFKDSLLLKESAPRLIFVGGSNLSFGLNSQAIKDSLKVNPINTGVHFRIGLVYMMDNTLRFIKKGDIVVLSPEYHQFYGDFAYGDLELLLTVMDVNSIEFFSLRQKQLGKVLKYIPKYSLSKFNPSKYNNKEEGIIYALKSFNKYGDVDAHWKMKPLKFDLYDTLVGNFNQDVVNKILEFQSNLKKKGAKLLITFPPFGESNFKLWQHKINKITQELKAHDFVFLTNPEQNIISDTMLFNTSYHLTKAGVDLQTKRMIEVLKKQL